MPLAGSVNPEISEFELDGNAVGGGANDWDSRGTPLVFTGFRTDPTDSSDTGYGSGQTKDTKDVSQWTWEQADVTPAKSDIVNDYAAAYVEDGNLILYFGQNRQLDRNGDANVGFWFLQNSIGLSSNGSFSGTHADGDLLVQSEFTNGGDISGIRVFKWQGGGITEVTSNVGQCTDGKLGTRDACAIVNSGSISTSWAGDISSPYFYEGGVNLSALFPQSLPCFSTFLTNTRTSQSESADLKDFGLGSIDTCASIKISKTAAPSDGSQFDFTTTGGLNPAGFQLGDGGSRSYAKLQPGSYSVTESGLTGSWAFDSLSCSTVSGPNTSAQVSGQTVNIQLGFVGHVECTYVNKRKPQVRVMKVLDPVSDSGKFDLQVNGQTQAAGVGNGGDTGFKEVAAGSQVTVGELASAGTSLGNYVSSVSCDSGKGGSQTTAHSFTASFGDQVTCTITNHRKPDVKVVKALVPVNDSGKFNLLINGNVELANAGNGGDTGFKQVAAGSVTASETAGTGSNLSDYNSKVECDSGKGGANPGTSHGFSVAYGDRVTCTITNTRKATLHVIKTVVNDNGGTKQASDFAISVSGQNASPSSFPGAASPGTLVTLDPGQYGVSETEDPGYAATYSAGCSGTIPAGGTATCTITNNDKPATLTVVKTVVNDNGGTATSASFTMTINGITASGGNSFPGAAAPGVTKTLTSVGSYSVSESSVAGYVQTSASVDCSGTIALGQSKTCTIVNDDRAAELIVKKVVVNDNGGTKQAQDFSFQVNGGQAQAFEADGQNNLSVPAGTYTVVEPAADGYATTYSNCTNVAIPNGGTATCTITNNDRPATLIVKKVVVNDNGGTKHAQDFSFQVNGGSAQSFEADGRNDLSVSAGTYTVVEPAVDGYATSYDNCSQVVIPNGGTATCTVTNDDRPATLIVKKVVVNDNGGTKVASDFSFQVNGGQAQSFEADGQNDLTVNAGTYSVVESLVAGYTTTYQGCSNIVLPIAGTATCVVTNNDVPRGQGSISVSKSANPTSIKEPGGPVSYSVTITNTSADVLVTVDNVVDDKFGDLDDDGGNGCFDVPINLVPGGKVNCSFTKTIAGVGGTSHVNVVTVSAHDENGHPLSASDDAKVDITPRLIDLVIVKDATSPTPLNGTVNYTLTVTNKGPDTATDVQLADPAPAGITYLTANPSQGTCNLSPALVTCSLGTIAPGQTVRIAVTGKATVVGTLTNTATVIGSGGRETNPADNVDSAVTTVPAPLKPPKTTPKAQPKPQPKPEPCLSLTVSPKMIKADGRPDRVVAVVTAGGKRVKGVRVAISGGGVSMAARTNGRGVAILRVDPKKPGILTIAVVESNQKLCGPKRIGVVGVFLPPLTG